MIEVVKDQYNTTTKRFVYYSVLVDGQSVARYPSRNEAEAHAEQLRKEAGNAN